MTEQEKSPRNDFYVYVYCDPRKPGDYIYEKYKFLYEPFYVGKGRKRRWLEHLTLKKLENNGNSHLKNKLNKIISLNFKPITFKYKEHLNEQQSLDIEKDMIIVIGRLNIKTGPLVNIVGGGGGEVGSGYIRSEEYLKKQSEAQKGKHNKPLTEEHKRKISLAISGKNNPNFGRCMSDEQKIKISRAKKGTISPQRGKTVEELYGKKRALELKIKNSESHKGLQAGKNNPNYGKRGKNNPNFGKHGRWHWSEETKKKFSFIRRGIPSYKKGKTVEELYGKEKAKELRKKFTEIRFNYWKNKKRSLCA